MDKNPHFNPTLLVGVGGRGSAIVDQIYNMIPADQRAHVKTHVFDTNVNDLKTLGLTPDDTTQTSTSDIVQKYLRRGLPTGEEWQQLFPWFPRNPPPEVLTRTLTQGAGQIRLLSRLAFQAAIEAGKMEALRTKIRALYQASGQSYETKPRVFVVSTLAGGTGSGIAIQVALLLRRYFQELLGDKGEGVLIKGAFLLPDVLIDTNVIADTRQHDNIRANAYATLKEIDAITRMSRGSEERGYRNIELDYCPGQTNEQGEQSSVLPLHVVPYDYSFLFDSTTCGGGTYPQSRVYEAQVAQAVYTQLFSPIAANTYSEEDNQILKLIGDGGETRYCGAGAARLEYPYEDLLSYCATRWVSDQISGDWLAIDRAYRAEVLEHEREEAIGIKRGPPADRGKRFIDLLEQYGGAGDNSFFADVWAELHEKTEDGKRGPLKADRFVDAVAQYLEKRGDAHLSALEDRVRLDDARIQKLGVRGKCGAAVAEVEQGFRKLRGAVESFVAEHWRSLERDIVLRDATNAPQLRSELPHRLNTWMLLPGGQDAGALHPLAARAFLYKCRQLIADRQLAAEGAAKDALESFERKHDEFDLKATPDIKETDAARKAEETVKQPFWMKIFGNEFKEFSELYIANCARRLLLLQTYRKAHLAELVYKELAAHVAGLIEGWELLFSRIEDVVKDLRRTADELAGKHDSSVDPTIDHVLASRSVKDALWEDVRLQLGVRGLPAGANRRMVERVYLEFARGVLGDAVTAGAESRNIAEVVLRDEAVGWCRNEIHRKALLDLDVIAAMRKQAKLEGVADEAGFIKQRIARIDNLAQPLIPTATDHPLQKWGINDKTLASIAPQDQSDWLGESTSVIGNAGFSRYALTRYRAYYGLRASEFPKFKSPSGRYYLAYRARIEELEKGKTVTPHLDARWHWPAYMPELDDGAQKRSREEILSSFVLGRAYGIIVALEADGQRRWYYKRQGGSLESIKVDDQPVSAQSDYRLYEALRSNPGVCDQVLAQVDELRKKDFDEPPKFETNGGRLSGHRFSTVATRDLVESIVSMSRRDPGAKGVEQVTVGLLEQLFAAIHEHYQEAYGAGQVETATMDARRFARSLADSSETWSRANKESVARDNWDGVLKTVFGEELEDAMTAS